MFINSTFISAIEQKLHKLKQSFNLFKTTDSKLQLIDASDDFLKVNITKVSGIMKNFK